MLAVVIPLRAQDLPQLSRAYLEQRTPVAETALRQFAAARSGEQLGALAYLVLGYTKFQDKEFAAAAEDLRKAVKVKTRASDYAEFYLAAALQNNADHRGALPWLTGFESRHADSYLIPRAAAALGTGLLATGAPGKAAEWIAPRLASLPHPSADLLLGNAWEGAGQNAKAVKVFREIYYRYPASLEAVEADSRKEDFEKPTVELLQARADALLDAGTRNGDRAQRTRHLQAALVAYRELIEASQGATQQQAQVKLGRVYHTLTQSTLVRTTLLPLKLTDPEAAAERLYLLGEAHRRLKRRADFLANVSELGKRHPTSSWYEEALFSAANATLLSDGAIPAASLYGKLAELFPQGKYAAQSHWKVAWTRFREGRREDALRLMQSQAERYPASTQASGALYWAARLSENAATWFQKLVDGYPLSFYGLLARQRNPGLQPGPRTPKTAIPTPEAASRREKVALLRSVWLLDLAANESRQAAQNDKRNEGFWWLELAGLERDRGRYAAAIISARQYVPDYVRYEVDQLPRRYWEALYPLPWWDMIKEEAAKEGQDPYLMAGLIRQESAFNEKAVSRANARGLMQILPSTGRTLARRLRLPGYNVNWLFTPRTNIRLGIVYFKQLIAEHGGKLEDTLAAYNAGPDRVATWREAKYGDDQEFVECIPFTETREYVQIVLRNAEIYRRLYK